MHTIYTVVTPVRDEALYLPQTIQCMVNQTVRPVEWVVVNDGSTDDTGNVIDEAAKRNSWIRAVHRANRGYREAGGGVVQAFNEGYSTLSHKEWDFVVKLDGDLTFEPDYFERCFERFAENERLGVGGGAIYHNIKGALEIETCPRFHVRGATKIYRRACWEALGGLLPSAGWDTLDEVKAQMRGWRTESFVDLMVTHHRITGAADGGWRNSVKNGRGSFVVGYHPLYIAVRCMSGLLRPPIVVGSIGLAYGYIRALLDGTDQVSDREVISYVRNQQLRRLTGRSTMWR
ncbi:MAG: glycosyltransferase family A protein [Bryobacteraceae bacterium]